MDAPHDDVPIPALLRAARGAYGEALRSRLAASGFDDLPRNGPYVLGGMENHGGTAGVLVRELGISKQATAQLLDTLVLRGYLERQADPDDRRRQRIELTPRGRAAAVEVGAAVGEVDDELARLLSPRQLAGLRAGLFALADIRERRRDG